jgi:hypothetical protein
MGVNIPQTGEYIAPLQIEDTVGILSPSMTMDISFRGGLPVQSITVPCIKTVFTCVLLSDCLWLWIGKSRRCRRS